MDNIDRIARCFVGKKVLITGGTGFIGKVLIEKLLRVCPEVDEIILILRSKKGKDAKQRLEEIFQNPLFDKLLSTRNLADVMSKVTVVSGDMSERELGLSEKDREICRTAHIIIHSAATVRFDEGIKTAVLLNTRGTKYILDLAKECFNLKLVVHVSTAFCHPEQKVLENKFYPPPADPHDVITAVEAMDEATSDNLSAKLIGDYPNTYTYSKSLAEALVEEYMSAVPVVIVRPSIVIPAYKEPLVGWTDNINGPVGIFIGIGKGVIRTVYGNGSHQADLVPVDVVINVILTMIWDYVENGHPHKIMNIALSDEISITWRELLDLGRDLIKNKVPFNNMLWYPRCTMTTNLMLHKLRVILYHWVPAIVVDTLLLCVGYKPILLRIQSRISKRFEVFEYYSNNQWFFKIDNVRVMRHKLNKIERQTYTMDADDLNLTEYFEKIILSARRYIMKEKEEDIPRAKRNLQILRILDFVIKGMFFYFIFIYVFKYLCD